MALQLLAPELAQFQQTGEPPGRQGNRHPRLAPQGVYPTAGEDRWLALSVTSDEAWLGLRAAMGQPRA